MTRIRKPGDRKAASKVSKGSIEEGKRGQRAAPGSPETDKTVLVDRRATRDRRTPSDRRAANVPVGVERRKLERRVKVSRRRQIDPTTCERDYTTDEIEFMTAMDQYKRLSGRMFPTCSEILEVLRNLGYEKRLAAESGPINHHQEAVPAAPIAGPQNEGPTAPSSVSR